MIDDSEEIYVVSEQAQVLRTSLSEIRSMGRATQGVTIFKPAEGDAVASISCVSDLTLAPDANGVKANGKANGKAAKNAKPQPAPTAEPETNGRANGVQTTLDDLLE